MISPEEKYQLILDAERQLAYVLAKGLIDKPKVSVWLILMPILFVYYAHKIQTYKKGVHAFAEGFLKTKTEALNAALQEVTSQESSGEFLDRVTFTEPNPGDPEKTRRVRIKQRGEMDLLVEHYAIMLKSDGTDYETLLRNAYEHGGAYRVFLNRLTKAEEEVNRAVLEAFHPNEEAKDIVDKMETMVRKLRENQLNAVFG